MEIKVTPWNFFKTYKYKDWKQLSTNIQDRLALAICIILDDIGKIPPSPEIIKQKLDNGMKICEALQT